MGKRANHAGSVTKKIDRKNGVEYISWRCRWTDPYGKVKEKRFDSETEAQAFLTQTLADIQNGEYVEPSTITLSQWLDIWIKDYSAKWKYQTLISYSGCCKNHIKPALGKTKLCQLTAPQIQSFLNELQRTGKKHYKLNKETGLKELVSCSPLSPKTIKNIHGTLSKALSKAVDVGFLRANPAIRVELPHVDKPVMHPLDSSQLNDYLAACSMDEDFKFYFMVLPLTGMREMEATGLCWNHVDFKAGTITVGTQLIKRSIAEGGYYLDTPKNHKTRIIKPAPFVMTLLAARKIQQDNHKKDAGDLWQKFKTKDGQIADLVFTTRTGKYLNPVTLNRHGKKILSSVGMEESVIHDLRHSFAVLGIQSGDDFKTISDNLGHATVAFTMDRYGHLTDKMRDESSKRMQALLDSIAVQ